MRPATVAGVQEVGGRGPGAESAEPEIIPVPTTGVQKLHQADADVAPVVYAKHLHLDDLPRVRANHPMVVECHNEFIPLRAGRSGLANI